MLGLGLIVVAAFMACLAWRFRRRRSRWVRSAGATDAGVTQDAT
jgi:hypothetical protein